MFSISFECSGVSTFHPQTASVVGQSPRTIMKMLRPQKTGNALPLPFAHASTLGSRCTSYVTPEQAGNLPVRVGAGWGAGWRPDLRGTAVPCRVDASRNLLVFTRDRRALSAGPARSTGEGGAPCGQRSRSTLVDSTACITCGLQEGPSASGWGAQAHSSSKGPVFGIVSDVLTWGV